MRDFAQVKADGHITSRVAIAALEMLKVDAEGFDALDRRLLGLIIDHFDGGPVGVESLAAALSEERGTIEDVLEPFLIQQGFLQRTSRGRCATALAFRHFGLTPPTPGAANTCALSAGTPLYRGPFPLAGFHTPSNRMFTLLTTNFDDQLLPSTTPDWLCR